MTTTPAQPKAPPLESNTPAAIPPTPFVRPDFSGRRLRLTSRPIPGYHLCWVNDTAANVEEYQNMGYEFVTGAEQGRKALPGRGENLGEAVRAAVGTQGDGSPMYAYLMKLPDLLFQEGMRSIDERNKAVQDSLRRTLKQAQGLGDSKDAAAFYNAGGNIESQDVKVRPKG